MLLLEQHHLGFHMLGGLLELEGWLYHNQEYCNQEWFHNHLEHLQVAGHNLGTQPHIHPENTLVGYIHQMLEADCSYNQCCHFETHCKAAAVAAAEIGVAVGHSNHIQLLEEAAGFVEHLTDPSFVEDSWGKVADCIERTRQDKPQTAACGHNQWLAASGVVGGPNS